ncbi:MAG: xanthine dehydrogenase family protein subunit M [Actinomycetota bacterium]|nr:xanthine dehydrogenase family protein subunit M [Actinomycetota bacterium]
MIPAGFDYLRATSVDEALAALVQAGEDAKVLAGGQSLLPLLRLRLAYPSTLVDVGGVPEMHGVREDGDGLVIGAMTTHYEVVHDRLIAQHCPVIAQATELIADPAVRHRGTFGGALAHADPAGDLPAVALALDASFTVAGPGGRRSVAAGDFFVDYLQTAMSPDELLVEIRVPKLGEGWAGHYEKFNRVAQAWAIVAVCALVRRDGDSVAEARIGLTNMGPTPLRATAAEEALAGASVHNGDIGAAAERAAEGTRPAADLNAAPDYRQHLARVLTRRALTAALGS